MNSPTFDVRIVDDDDELTAEIVERELRKDNRDFHILAARGGQDGIDVLRGKTERKIRRPYLILLDLNMPKMNGFEFHEELRGDPELCESIVFVRSTSDADADRTRANQEMVAGYMIKSAIGPQFAKLADLLKQYISTITLP